VIGLPNTGKSSLINGLAKRTAAKTENKAGVTRSCAGSARMPNWK
jgi:ribosome biogenesis GTPase A